MAGAPQGYIGRNPSDGRTTINRQTFNVTTGVQTSFTFTSGYDLGYFDVYLNGIKQNETTDYTAADGSTFSFSVSTPAVQGDTIEAIAYKSFNTTNVTGSTRDFNVGRNLDVAGNVTIGSSLTIASDLVVNGSYTYVNTEILDIEDKTVGIASTSAASNTTADGAGIVVYGGSDGDKSFLWNKTKSNWVLVGGGVSIGTGCTIGSSTANVLEFSVDGAVNAKLNNYGAFIVGDGVAGEAWGNSYKTVQAGSGAFGGNAPAANAASYWTNNAYFDDVNSRWEYIAADEASRFEQGNGALAYYNASAGSADGAITWSERLRIDSDGRLLLGTTTEGHTSADDLTIATSGHTGMTIRSGASNSGSIYFSSATSGGDEYNGYIIYDQTNDSLRFGTNENDRVTFNSSGNALFTGIVTATSFSGPMSGTTGTFTGDVSIADKIIHIGDTDTAIRFPAADTITFETASNERFRIASGGQLLSGLTTPYSTVLSSQTPKIQLESTSVSGSSMFLLRDGTDAGGPFLFLGHSRGGATIVQDDDELGNITFVGADGTNFQNAAAIKGYVDGTPGSGTDMPGRLSFWTSPDGSTTMAERLRITADGKFSFGTGADPSSQIVSYVSDSGDNLLKFANSTTGSSANDGFDIGIDSNEQAKIWLYEDDNLIIGNNDTTRIYIKKTGQVGIATEDPYAPLHVKTDPETSQTGNFADNGILLQARNAGSHAVVPISCSFTGTSYLPRAAIGFIARPSADPIDNYAGAIGFYVASRADGSGLTMNDEVVRITKDGNVAIGNTGAGYYGPANDLVAGNTSGDHGISIISGTADAGVIAFGDAASSTSDAYRRGQILYMHNTDAMHFRTGGNTDRAIINASGRLLIGTTDDSTVWGFGQGSLQVKGDWQGGSAAFINNEDNTNNHAITLAKVRGSSVVNANDVCGSVAWNGYDGSAFKALCRVTGEVDGTPGSSDMPGRMVFYTTPDGGSTPVERIRINQNGIPQISNAGETLFGTGVTAINIGNGVNVSMADDASFTMSGACNTGAIISIGTTKDASGNIRYRHGLFFAQYGSTTVTELSDTESTFAVSDSDGYVCVYATSSVNGNIVIKNRLGHTSNICVTVIRLLGN